MKLSLIGCGIIIKINKLVYYYLVVVIREKVFLEFNGYVIEIDVSKIKDVL